MPLLDNISEFMQSHMRKGKRYVPARLQAAIALTERLRECPSLDISDHKRPNSSGLISHETYGDAAHNRLKLEILNKNHGRRSCDVGEWGPKLLDMFASHNFANISPDERARQLDAVQSALGAAIRVILESDPIFASIATGSAESVIRDIIRQADSKGKGGDVAQYLVGAKLMLRLNKEIPVLPANQGDRKSRIDSNARAGDFEVEDAIVEVAIGPPDNKHLQQVADALRRTAKQVWLLTRHEHVPKWKVGLELLSADLNRVVISSVEAFVGQNMTEMGEFSTKGISTQFERLFDLYNNRWIEAVGTPEIRIVVK